MQNYIEEYHNNNNKSNMKKLQILLDIKKNIELKISFFEEIENFNEILQSLPESPSYENIMSDSYIYQYVTNSNNNRFNNNVQCRTHKTLLNNIVQQIKSTCNHNYTEDYVDMPSKTCKITYCSICNSTF